MTDQTRDREEAAYLRARAEEAEHLAAMTHARNIELAQQNDRLHAEIDELQAQNQALRLVVATARHLRGNPPPPQPPPLPEDEQANAAAATQKLSAVVPSPRRAPDHDIGAPTHRSSGGVYRWRR
jgi:hypothetical protein